MSLILLIPGLAKKAFAFIGAHLKAFAVVVAAALLLIVGYHFGAAHVQNEWDAQKAATAKAVAVVAKKQDTVSDAVQTKIVTRLQVIHDKGATITKQVIKYVPLSTPDLPYGFRLLHDAAAAGVPLPDPAASLDGPAVPAATVAATVSDNYAGCRADAATIKAWQAWATREAAATK